MGTREALEVAVPLGKHFEGFSPTPYLCPAGYWTIGYGTVFKPDGKQVTKDDPPISRHTAEQWLIHEMKTNYMMGVLKASPHLIAHPKILGAITDFAYNLGVARYRASTLRKRIDERNWNEAIVELKKWIRGGGRVLPGLVRRRDAESLYMRD